MNKTEIPWTDRTWNVSTGCTKKSEGCRNCYAKTLHDMRHKAYKEGKRVPEQYAVPFEKVMLHYDRLKLPNWKTPQKVFVNSMSDLFHHDISFVFISRVMESIKANDKHVFQVLTKRAEQMRKYFKIPPEEDIIKNLWLGVTAENQETADERIPILLDTPAAIRWVSIEPMLEEIDLRSLITFSNGRLTVRCDSLTGQIWHQSSLFGEDYDHDYKTEPEDKKIDWVVVGCESGKNRRPCKIEWIENIVEQCKSAGVPVFVKQIEIGGRVIKDVKQFPQHLQIQEFPR